MNYYNYESTLGSVRVRVDGKESGQLVEFYEQVISLLESAAKGPRASLKAYKKIKKPSKEAVV
jgi:hypothetical protein